MSVTGVRMARREEYFTEIEKITQSKVLHGSESLCKMLRYLAEQAVEHPGVSLKEYQIATEVFGRPADFDPQSDSTIRVQAGRLRLKLAEYYATEGAADAIIAEMPKGAYALSFHHRASVVKTGSGLPDSLDAGSASGRAGKSWAIAVVLLSILLAVCVVTIAMQLQARNGSKVAASAETEPVPQVFREFWNGVFSDSEEPWLIFSNGAFVGRPETGMRYFDATHDTRNQILDHYTGVGEVLAVHNIDHVFGLLRRGIRVKRGSLFSLDDAKNNDLIFVGSPEENLTLREIPNSQEFVFKRFNITPRKGVAILNVHPQLGEEKVFFASAADQPLTEDYAVVAYLKGLNPTRSVLILAGTTTIGTQAAAEFVCSPNLLRDLLQRLNVSNADQVKPFEALLRVKVTQGVPVDTQVLSLRKSAQ